MASTLNSDHVSGPVAGPVGGAAAADAQRPSAAAGAQAAWARTPLVRRLEVVRRFRHALVDDAAGLAAAVHVRNRVSPAETIAAEVLPLADACRFVERRAASVLRPKTHGPRWRPLWLFGTRLSVVRQPLGTVLIVGPGNYPLLLPGVQALQALAAGNAVLWKPGRHGAEAAQRLAGLWYRAGLDPLLLRILPESVSAVYEAVEQGVDKVLLTGSAPAGRAVLARLAAHVVPATLELSGCDAMFVRDDADLDLVEKAVCFGLRFNGSATCIAPRRLLASRAVLAQLEPRLSRAVAGLPAVSLPCGATQSLLRLLTEALDAGARLLCGGLSPEGRFRPVVLAAATPAMRLLQSDVFAPVVSLVAAETDDDALAAAARCPYALGATVFGRRPGAESLAARIGAGCVVVNDMIVPTADPRLPFGGRKQSGYGVTRGAEGLLEMTVPQAIVVRRNRWVPHLEHDPREAADLLWAYLRATHSAGISARLRGWAALLGELVRRGRRATTSYPKC